YPARWFLNALRGVDSFVFALLFVAAVGLGPFAGVLGIALHTWGSTAKLWAEAIENIPLGPLEGAAVTGASRLKVLAFALLPDVGERRRGDQCDRADEAISAGRHRPRRSVAHGAPRRIRRRARSERRRQDDAVPLPHRSHASG